VFIERKVLGPADLDRVRKAGAVGEILGRFYDKAGDEVQTPFRQRVVSIGLEELRRVKRVLAVVAGGNRAAAIRAAVRGGLVKSLVIDDEGAKALLGGKQ
jgi:DNA-binding transcriptional regulator LsrR (DeoR family)